MANRRTIAILGLQGSHSLRTVIPEGDAGPGIKDEVNGKMALIPVHPPIEVSTTQQLDMVRVPERFACLAALVALTSSFALAKPEPFKFSLSAVKRAAPNPENIKLTDYINGTDLQWYGSIQVGTPPQNFTVIFDSGGSDLMIPVNACTSCTNQNRFDPSKSSTFANYTSNSPGQPTPPSGIAFGTGLDEEEWEYDLYRANDSVTLGGLTVHNASFFLITHQTPAFNPDPFDGILGLNSGQPGGFYPTLIDQGLPKLFSFFLTRNNTPQAELTLGGIDSSKYSGGLVYADVIFPGIWQLNSTGISVNGKTSSILTPMKSLQPVISSAVANFVFPKELAEAVYALISSDIKPFAAEPGAYGIECSKINTLPAVIDVGFKDQSGKPFNLTIPSSELNVGPFASDKSICQTFINAENNFDVEFNVPVLGGSLLKHYYSVWDFESGNGRIGFATPKE